jgi:predicted MPP superfamily phosphohydrolase
LDGSAKTAMALPFVAGGYGTFIGRDHFEVRETELGVKGLSADLDGLRIVQISDFHYGPYLDRKDLRRVVGMANELRPQIAFLTGDFITREGDPLEECLDELARLRADSGLWGCLGNHEEFAKCSDLTERYAAQKGIQVLRKRAHGLRFGDSKINLIGVDYQRQRGGYLAGVAELVDASAFNVLLSHNPDVFPTAAAAGCDLTLSGHTHGGQVTVEIVEQTLNPGRFFTPFVVGEYRIGQKAAYVTRGVGTVNMPMRIGAMPEIAAIVLRSA